MMAMWRTSGFSGLLLTAVSVSACGSGAGGIPATGSGGGAVEAGGAGGSAGSESAVGGGPSEDCVPACGEGAHCDVDTLTCVCDEAYYGDDPQQGCEPVPVPLGFIGSPCDTDDDCDYSGGFCQVEQSGYPWGHCSFACDQYCPDQATYPTTFCIEPPQSGAGNCFSQCDYDVYPYTDACRPGYQCRISERFGDPSTSRPVCVPSSWLADAPCADLGNLNGDDDCYFKAISYGQAGLETLARALLAGQANATQAEQFLDQNFAASQNFIAQDLGLTIHPNYSAGHSSSQPMVGAIVHYTAAQREDGTIGYFVSSDPHASSHFIIGSARNGLIVQLFSHENRTWHAGSTYNIDRFGIDFANAGYLLPDGSDWVDYADRDYTMWLPLHGDAPIQVTGGIPGAESKYAAYEYWQPYTYYQLLSYVMLGRALHKVYDLEPSKIERHGDVAASRVDPGPHFPMTYLKELVLQDSDVLQIGWLQQYKQQADWIAQHPEAR